MQRIALSLLLTVISISISGGICADSHTAIARAVSNSARPEADSERDATRKPAEVLEFFAIDTGMKVLDIFAGGGYYTEILSYTVGPEGEVGLYNNGGWDGFVGEGVVERLADKRLPNVQSIVMEANVLSLEANYYDAAIFVLGFHDLYYSDEPSWPAIDAENFIDRLYRVIKPGGVLGIVDHAAEPGVSVAVADLLHRIDPGIIRRDLISAGFVLEAESDILRNALDDRNKPMSDPSVRGNTDRVVMRFRKPSM